MPDPQPHVLETDVPLSQSLIWRLQRDFYVKRGLKAWTEDRVPEFITNNPFIAEIYARIVFNFLADCGPAGKPLRILEVGAGTGKFSYLFLRHLAELLRAKGFEPEAVRYCMTDCSEALLQSWRGNRYLAEFAERGMLEFEPLQAGAEINSRFLSGKGPLAVIANYVFDGLPQDAFVIRDGRIYEALVSTTAAENPSPSLSHLQLSYKNVDVAPNRYSDAIWNRILELYRNSLPTATILFPSGALNFLEDIGKLTDGPMLVLAADKGFPYEGELALCQGTPTLEFHAANCFSQMVNLDAIAKYFRNAGGTALMPQKHSSSLSICGFLQGKSGNQFPATSAAYEEAQATIGPDDLFILFAWLNAHMEEMTVAQILSALRLTRWDPIAFLRLFPVLARQLRTVSLERMDLREAVMRVWANHYPLNASENEIAFDCGVVLLELRFYDDALAMFKESQRIFGASAATSYNLGLCHQGMGRCSEAQAFMVDACNLDPKFEPARRALEKLQNQNRASDPVQRNELKDS